MTKAVTRFVRGPAVVQLAGNASNASVQAALGSSCFILMHQAFADERIDFWHGFFIKSVGFFGIAGGDSMEHGFDCGAHARTQSDIVLSTFLALSGAFGGLFAVCHEAFLCQLPNDCIREPRILVIQAGDVNRNSGLASGFFVYVEQDGNQAMPRKRANPGNPR